MTKSVVVLSGGLDSTVAAYAVKRIENREVVLISFNYGQRHSKELTYAAKTSALLNAPHYIVDMSNITSLISNSALTNPDIEVPEGHYAADTMKATVVPNRNAIMIAIASGLAVNIGAENVVVGVHAGDHIIYPDCRPEFVNAMTRAMYLGNQGFGSLATNAVRAPFLFMSKSDIVALGASASVPFENTWSCYKGGALHCGRCATCIERREAFTVAGVEDPTQYEDPRPWQDILQELSKL